VLPLRRAEIAKELIRMPNVMITCPTTKKAVATGFKLDRRSFETADLANKSFKCRICGQTHTWSKEDAFLDGTGRFSQKKDPWER